MTAEEQASRARLARLRRELSQDLVALVARAEEAREVLQRWGDALPERPWLVVGAVAIHGWYTGLEALLERVVRAIDQEVPSGEGSHRALLSQALTEIEGLRPPVLPPALERDLLSLLAFRHFFRHAYAVELDPEKLRAELSRLARVHPDVKAALEGFDAFLAEAEAALRG